MDGGVHYMWYTLVWDQRCRLHATSTNLIQELFHFAIAFDFHYKSAGAAQYEIGHKRFSDMSAC